MCSFPLFTDQVIRLVIYSVRWNHIRQAYKQILWYKPTFRQEIHLHCVSKTRQVRQTASDFDNIKTVYILYILTANTASQVIILVCLHCLKTLVQNNASTQRACQTVQLLQQETTESRQVCGHATVPPNNPHTYIAECWQTNFGTDVLHWCTRHPVLCKVLSWR